MINKINLQSARILAIAIILSLSVLSYVVHTHYGEEIKTEISMALVELLPDLDRSLAQL